MTKTLLFTLFFPAFAAAAQADLSAGDPLAGSGPFSDPAFQDCLETSEDGYLNSKNTMNVRSDFRELPEFRDAVISAPARSLKTPPVKEALPENRPGLPALPPGYYKVTFAGDSGPVGSFVWPMDAAGKYSREYALLGVSIKGDSYGALLPALEAEGLRFAGEKTSYSAKNKRTVILGWAPYTSIAVISRLKGVTGVVVEKRNSGVPLKARVRFTLKVPYQNKPNAFVPAFIKRLSADKGFSADNWFRLPQKNPDSRFSVFDVTGTMPVDLIGELSRSPFVASVEFNDNAL